jgi:drug/metabolite transporter (DMT)-like permease
MANIKIEWFEIIYTGVFSAGIGYTLQIIAQSKASPAPAAIILSMESVFGTLAGWIILNQVLDINKVLGCLAIFLGVIIVQLIPIYTSRK